MFDDRTQAQIKAELLGEISPDTGLSAMAGSYADATIGPVAGQISQVYKALPAVTSMLFIDETSGGYIDLVGGTYFNITRRPGTRAVCDITLTGDPGTVIPQGAVFLTATGLRFALEEAVTIPAEGTAAGRLEAAEEGAAYNILAGAITSMYVNVPGLASYVNGEASGGTDTESDAALCQRIAERRQKPINGANGWQYRAWAMEIPGVGEAKVVELADGPGTVKVYLVDSNMEPAAGEIVEEVQALLDAQRPVGAAPQAAAPETLEISVTATVVLRSAVSAETVRAEMEARLREYLAGLVQQNYAQIYYTPEEDRPYTLIYNRLLALLLTIDGVEDATSLTVNGGTEDIQVSAGQAPVLGSVEVTV